MNDVKAFKNELKNFKYYKNKIIELTDEIDNIYYSLSGLSSKPFGANVGSTNQQLKELNRLNAFGKAEMLKSKRELYKSLIVSIEQTLEAMDSNMRSVCIKVYCDGRTYESIARTKYYSARGLEKKVDKEIQRALEK